MVQSEGCAEKAEVCVAEGEENEYARFYMEYGDRSDTSAKQC